MTSLSPHPYADKFPMLPEGELQELAESIRENGLRHPVVITADGLILDGRNRAAACDLIGITPETVTYEGDDLAEYVIDSNITRRNMNDDQRAMSTALVLAEDGRRGDGRWKRDSLEISENFQISKWARLLRDAGTVLDWLPELADQVIAGDLPLKVAYAQAIEARDRVDTEKRAKAIEASRKREATIKEKADNDRKLQALTEATSRYLTQVEAGNMSIAAAYAAHMEDTRKHRERERELDMGRRDSCTHIAEAVRMIAGGTGHAEVFLRDFYPHEERFLAYGMRLTRERIDSAIEFLTVLKKEVTL